MALGTSSRTLVVGATCVVVVKEVSRCGGGTGSAAADAADAAGAADAADGADGGGGGGTGGGRTGDPLAASLGLARLDGLSRASLSSELCRRRVSCRNRKPRRPNMAMHPPSSSPAAKEATAESMGHTINCMAWTSFGGRDTFWFISVVAHSCDILFKVPRLECSIDKIVQCCKYVISNDDIPLIVGELVSSWFIPLKTS